jgi:hypothetical protein
MAYKGTETDILCGVEGNLVPRACDPWEGNEGSGIIRIRHTENCMSTELRMRWRIIEQNINFILWSEFRAMV